MSDTKLVFKTSYLSKPFIPPSFKIAGNQTILRINGVVLPMCAGRLVARLFQSQPDLLQALGCDALTTCDHLQGSIKAQWRDYPQDLFRDRHINARIPKGQTFDPLRIIAKGTVA